jgi:hypothetical protein
LIKEKREEECLVIYKKITHLTPENLDYRQRLIGLYDKSGLKDKVVEKIFLLLISAKSVI